MVIDTAIETARLLVGEWAREMTTPAPNRLDVYLKRPEDLAPATAGLRVKRMGYLAAVTGLDLGNEEGELEALYHFCTGPVIVTLRARFSRKDGKLSVPTLSDIIPNAESFERELSEMFGINVVGLRNTEHLYLPDSWPHDTYPLRKDFDPQILGEKS